MDVINKRQTRVTGPRHQFIHTHGSANGHADRSMQVTETQG
ncbi:hypothetical protein [Thiohalocapsa marina]|nr:hypothetical protein [Thiohalocapsa marina]